MRYGFSFGFALALGLALMAGCSDNDESGIDTIEWVATVAVKSEQEPGKLAFRIAVSNSANSDVRWLTDAEFDDYKPAISPDGSKIAFWRAVDYGCNSVICWKSKLCVMNADGSGFRELTGGDYLDTVPYWTRDGSDQIVFLRSDISGGQGVSVYRTDSDAEPGDEQMISEPASWDNGYSSLKDGRLLVRRDIPLAYFLMTPNVGGSPVYEEITHPFGAATYMHKMTISPSETKVAYMKVENITDSAIFAQDIYANAVIAYADFDATNLRIENEVEITERDESISSWYPSWDPEEKHIIWAEGRVCRVFPESPCTPSGVVKAYSLETGITEQISSRDDLEYRYPTVVGQTK